MEAAELTENSVLNTLDKAHKQLPTDKPCVIFLKIPEMWTTDKVCAGLMAKVLNDFFRNSRRVAAVVIHWEIYADAGDDGKMSGRMYRIEHNPNARHSLVEFGQFIETNRQAFWRSIRQIVCGDKPKVTRSVAIYDLTSDSVEVDDYVLIPMIPGDWQALQEESIPFNQTSYPETMEVH